MNGNKVQILGDQVSVELKSREQLTISGIPPAQSSATLLAVPNLNQVNLSSATSQLPLTAINLSSTANPNNNHVLKNGILNIPSSVGSTGAIQQIITNSSPSFVHTMSNGQHVIMKGANNGFANKGNGLIIREAIPPPTSISDKMIKFGSNNGDMFDAASPAKIMKLVNGSAIGPKQTTFGTSADLSMTTTTTTTALPQQQQQHTQVLPIYKSTQNGGLRVIGHHTTTTSTPNGGHSLSAPSVVFSNEVTSKYQQHLPSGMVISGALPANLSQPYLSNSINGATGITTTTFGGVNPQVHKLLLTGMSPNMTAQNVSTGYPIPQMAQSSSGDFYARGSTSLPGGAQLNVCRSPSSTPSPTISITASSKGNGMKQKGEMGISSNTYELYSTTSLVLSGGRGGASAQFSNVSMVNGGVGGAGVLAGKSGGPSPQVSKVVVDANWHTNAASQHPYVPFQMISSVPTSLPIMSSTGSVTSQADVKVSTAGPKNKRTANGGGSARGAKRKSAAMAPTSIMITPQTSMEPVKSNPPTTMMLGKGFSATTTSMANESSGKVGSVTLTTTNFKPTIK